MSRPICSRPVLRHRAVGDFRVEVVAGHALHGLRVAEEATLAFHNFSYRLERKRVIAHLDAAHSGGMTPSMSLLNPLPMYAIKPPGSATLPTRKLTARRIVMNDTSQNQYDEHGKKHGHWVERHDDGDVWEGQYINGKKLGKWVLKSSDGDMDDGYFEDDKKHGHWVLRSADGDVYKGNFENGKKHGRWVEQNTNGDVREGKYWNGKRYGYWMIRYSKGGVEHKDYGVVYL